MIRTLDGQLIPALAEFLQSECESVGFPDVNWQYYTRQCSLITPISGAITYSIPNLNTGSTLVYNFTITMRIKNENRAESIAPDWLAFIRDYSIPKLSEGLTVMVDEQPIENVFKGCMMEYCHFPEEEINQENGSIVTLEWVINWKNHGIGSPENYMRFY